MPSKRFAPALFAVAVAAAGTLAIAVPALGEDPTPKPVAQIKDIMLTYNNGPQSVAAVLRDQFKGQLDDEGWEAAGARATMMYEAGNMLLGMKPPRGADDAAGLAKWKAHVADYRGCADAAREAVSKKDPAAGKAAMESLAKRCAECHKDHQKE